MQFIFLRTWEFFWLPDLNHTFESEHFRFLIPTKNSITWGVKCQKFTLQKIVGNLLDKFRKLYMNAWMNGHLKVCAALAFPQRSFGVRLSRIECVTNEPQRTSAGRLVPPHPVGLLRRFGLKTGIHFAHFGLESGMVFEGTTECMNVLIVSIPNE